MSDHTIRSYVERRFQKWLTEQPLDTVVDAVQAVNKAMEEILEDGIMAVNQMEGFDLEAIWER